jgi:hypothetical protein
VALVGSPAPTAVVRRPGVRCFHRFPMRRETAVGGEYGLPHGTAGRVKGGPDPGQSSGRRERLLGTTQSDDCSDKFSNLSHGRGPFALTPALSHSRPGSADRTSFGGRGGTRAAEPLSAAGDRRHLARWLPFDPSPPRGRRWPIGRMRGEPLHGATRSDDCSDKFSNLSHGRGPFALTPALSHSHPGSADRTSFGGRGGTRARRGR